MDQALLVVTNLPDIKSAEGIARRLIEQHLAACINILPSVHSVYWWMDGVEEAKEIMLMIKSTQMRYAQLETELKMVHPYQVPEIIAIPIVAGLSAYLDWIAMETKRERDA